MNRLLKIKIIEHYGTQTEFVRDLRSSVGLEMSEDRLSKLICGRLKPRDHEKVIIAQKLSITPEDVFKNQ